MNGVDAAMEILRAQPKCKVLFISGNAGYRDLIGKAKAKGFKFEVLEKPISPPKLLGKEIRTSLSAISAGLPVLHWPCVKHPKAGLRAKVK
jgi:CheY-like chemotaxis protein